MKKIIPIKALKDNYIWLILLDSTKKNAIIVDPGESEPVLNFLNTYTINLQAIFITHKHWDHCNGVANIVEKYPVPVYGPDSNSPISIHDTVFERIKIPGHTLEHVAFYYKNHLFTGDTLFAGGCGRLFEGTPEQMVNSLDKICLYPDDTFIYCGHEYTQSNLQFAQLVEPDNKYITQKLKNLTLPSLPTLLGDEKKYNPFLRCDKPSVISAVEKYSGKTLSNRIDVFTELRQWKNNS